jgi:ribosomal protein S18 acetylase RimI-like enzyme
MDEPVVVRQATPADLDAMVDVHTRARAAYYTAGGLAGTDDVIGSAADDVARRAGWARLIEPSTAGTAMCAVAAGQVVGVVSMGPPFASHVDPATTAQLRQIHVAPGRWGRGIGSLLHDAFVRYLERSALTAGVVEAWERNARAQAFYRRHGWHPDGHRRPGPGDADYVYLQLHLRSTG